MKALCILACCALLFITAAPAAEKPPLTLSIVPPDTHDQPENNRYIHVSAPGNPATFYVVMTNVSEKPVTIFAEWSSWGWFNIGFEAVTKDGQVVKLGKGEGDWTWNYPATFCIPPGGHYVFHETFSKYMWPDVEKLRKAGRTVTLKAVFEENNKEALPYSSRDKNKKVWEGRVESTPEAFEFYFD